MSHPIKMFEDLIDAIQRVDAELTADCINNIVDTYIPTTQACNTTTAEFIERIQEELDNHCN
jgi:hypothetical protein